MSASRRRRAAAPSLQPQRPVAKVLGALALAGILVAILLYAATNQGSGLPESVRNPDSIEGLVVTRDPAELKRTHVAGPVSYRAQPPSSGEHNAVPQTCAVYAAPVAPEHAVHSLEHGAVWVTYGAAVARDEVPRLAGLVRGQPYRMLSPLPTQDAPIMLSAWGRSLSVDAVDDPRVEQFLDAFTNGPQTPEPGAACVGADATGSLT